MEEAKQRLEHGANYPFDAPDLWWEASEELPPVAADWAHAAARGVVADLEDRHTIKHGFRNVDESVRIEIISSMAEIIRQAKAAEVEAGKEVNPE